MRGPWRRRSRPSCGSATALEGALAREERSRDDDGNPDTPRQALAPIVSAGLHAELAWVVVGVPRAVGEGPRGAPSTDGSWAGGALELAVRGELLGLGHQAPDVSPGDVLSGALCIRWFPTDFVAAALVAHATGYPTSPHDLPEEHVTWDVAVRLSAFWGQTALFVGP